MKILVIDLINPRNSEYQEIQRFISWTWGRLLSEYMFFLCKDGSEHRHNVNFSNDSNDSIDDQIKKTIKFYYGEQK